MRPALLAWALLLVAAAPAAAVEPTIKQQGFALELGQIALAPDGRSLYVTGDRTLTFARDPATGALDLVSDVEPAGDVLAVSPDGASVYVGGREWLHVLQRQADGRLLHVHTYLHGEDRSYGLQSVSGIVVSPDGRQVYLTARRDNAIFTFDRDPSTGLLWFRDARTGPALDTPLDLTAAPDGSTLYVAGNRGVGVLRRDAATGGLGLPELVENPWNMINQAVAVTPDGKTVLAGHSEYTAFPRSPDGGLGEPRAIDTRADDCLGCGIGRAILPVADGTVYAADWERGLINHVRLTAEDRELLDTAPIDSPRTMVMTSDGRFVYAGTGGGAERPPAAVATYRRDPDSGTLSRVGTTPATLTTKTWPGGIVPTLGPDDQRRRAVHEQPRGDCQPDDVAPDDEPALQPRRRPCEQHAGPGDTRRPLPRHPRRRPARPDGPARLRAPDALHPVRERDAVRRHRARPAPAGRADRADRRWRPAAARPRRAVRGEQDAARTAAVEARARPPVPPHAARRARGAAAACARARPRGQRLAVAHRAPRALAGGDRGDARERERDADLLLALQALAEDRAGEQDRRDRVQRADDGDDREQPLGGRERVEAGGEQVERADRGERERGPAAAAGPPAAAPRGRPRGSPPPRPAPRRSSHSTESSATVSVSEK